MPELPEVETIKRALENRVLGCVIQAWIPLREDYVRDGFQNALALQGCRIERVERRGKLLALVLSQGWVVLHHLGMSGRLLLVSAQEPLLSHTHLRVVFEERLELRQWDPRRFGYTAILPVAELEDYSPWASMGEDPFQITPQRFCHLLENRSQPIKSFLLDQRHLAGLGNIYADESLFRAGIHPSRAAGGLSEEEGTNLLRKIRKVLVESIETGGSSTHDYQKLDGTLGEYQNHHRVYRRTSLPCRVCKTPIERLVLNGRSTHFCPVCQPLNKTS